MWGKWRVGSVGERSQAPNVYGKHDHTCRRKNRLTLPAKFRTRSRMARPLSRGSEHHVYPEELDASIARIAEFDPLTRRLVR
jgi:DNA-binding transcriptional regulator/RsmH inhibitor MraZ